MPLSMPRWSALIGALAILPMPLAAQVRADVNVHIGPRPRHEVVVVRRPPVRRVVVAPRVVVVDRIHDRGHGRRSANWWRTRGYRPVTVYYANGRYYDRHFDARGPVRTVVVYQKDGRYYRDWSDRHDRGRDGRYEHRDRYYR